MLYNVQHAGQPRRLSEDNQIVQNNKEAYNTLAIAFGILLVNFNLLD